VDEERAVTIARIDWLLDLLEVDLELLHVLLGVCDYFGAIESNDVVADLVGRFIGGVGVIDAELVVEPGNLEWYEFGWYEALASNGCFDSLTLDWLAGEDRRRVT